MRPQGKNGNGQANAGSQAARPNGGSKDNHRPPNSNGGYRQDQTEKANGSRSAVQGDTLDERILSLKKAVGAGLYRNILRDYGRVPVLNQDTAECYVIPPSPPAITYAGLPLDAIEDALQRSVAMQSARGILVRKQQKMTGRPVTPLHEEHVGLLACSGMLNGFFGEGEMRHIAH